ncbi:hypothetical protein H4696_001960 [Amycolatopsis lexingtonensis]|uniref:Translation initiation factor IF-3 n=1 Tax=Amycolatopsis lexingtonensis TaxID=218822 RepID=A0ABR9HV97_9PSEU|nr:hypothetical protein [Amycolatopsis lexingtonensis]MBE1494860.1 hypothetical protein [Amycolatopsis lexingtonensis]
MAFDQVRRPDVPPPPQPKPPQPDAAKHADWNARNENTMTRRPERTPDVRPHQPAPVDGGRNPDVRADAGVRPEVKGQLSTDHRQWRSELRVVRETRDVKQWRGKPDGPVQTDRVRADFTKDVKQQAELQKGRAGGVLIDVRLRNVAVGKGSEAAALQRTLTDIGRKEGVLVRVSVVGRDGGLYSPNGPRLTPPGPRPILPSLPVPPGPRTPGQPPRPHPPEIHRY